MRRAIFLNLVVGALLFAPAARCLGQTFFTSAAGVRVIVQPDTSSETVAICVFIRGGVAEDDAAVVALAARSVFGANLQQSSDAVRRTIYDTGGSLESVYTQDYTLFTCVTTKDAFRDAVNLIANALKAPEFDSETVRRARAEVAADSRKLEGDTFQAGCAVLRSRLYDASPYRATIAPSIAALDRVGIAGLRRFVNRRYTPDRTIISIAGNVTLEQARTVVENQFTDYSRPAAGAARAVGPEPIPDLSRSERRIASPSSILLVGCLAPGITDPDYPAFLVLNALLGGGKSSRLFRDVRDRGAVGYSVGSVFPALAHPAHLIAYVEYDAARAATTDPAPNQSVEKLTTDSLQSPLAVPVTDAEVDRAKRFAIGLHALAHQRPRDRAFLPGLYETLGVGYAFDTDLPRRVAAVTRADVDRVARRYLARTVTVLMRGAPGVAAH